MINVIKYEKKYLDLWNDFLSSSKNGTFLFNRKYMEYHSDRFKDHSLIIFKNNIPVCLLPASERREEINSHDGLTYGGVILLPDANLFDVFEIFHEVLKYYNLNGFKRLNYKCIPSFFHQRPTFEDQYAIFLSLGKLVRVDTFFSMKISNQYNLQTRRKRGIKRAIKEGVKIIKTNNLKDFWVDVLTPNLRSKFGVNPVHSLREIELLKNKFPKNILQYNAIYKGKVVAGTTIYVNKGVAHAQYISSNELGKKTGAIDLLFHDLLTKKFNNFEWFSFGIANEDRGKKINVGLAEWKEGFGANVFPQYFYQVNTANYFRLEEYIKG